MKQTSYKIGVLSRFSPVQLFTTPWTVTHQAPLSMGFSGKNIGVGCCTFLQGIFLTQGSNPLPFHLLHWQVGSLAPPEKPISNKIVRDIQFINISQEKPVGFFSRQYSWNKSFSHIIFYSICLQVSSVPPGRLNDDSKPGHCLWYTAICVKNKREISFLSN